jgi:hypothetical protein
MPGKDPPRTPEQEAEERRQAALLQLKAEWDRKLAVLNEPDARDRVDALFDAGGRLKKRPKAGEF